MITKQEMFDRAVIGLRAQGFERSISQSGACVYHSPDGKKCAWGHVDPDGTKGRNVGLSTLHVWGIGVAGSLSGSSVDFALALQEAHDESASPTAMHWRFENLARAYHLDVTLLGEAP